MATIYQTRRMLNKMAKESLRKEEHRTRYYVQRVPIYSIAGKLLDIKEIIHFKENK